MTQKIDIPFVSECPEPLYSACLTHLQDALPEARVAPFDHALHQDCEFALVANPDPKVLMNMPRLKWVQSLWAGVEHLAAQLPQDIAIVRMVDEQLGKTMAEAVLATCLYLHRDFPLYAKQQRHHIWQQHDVTLPEDRKIGVLGLGEMGAASCAKLVEQDFDVWGWSRTQKDLPNVTCLCGDDGLDQLLEIVDMLVILLPVTNETTHLLNKARLSRMKQGAALVNFARAPIVETGALIELLTAGHIEHAVLDVFDTEPLPKADHLWDMPNVTLLPHITSPTNLITGSRVAATNIRSFLSSGNIPTSVDRARGY